VKLRDFASICLLVVGSVSSFAGAKTPIDPALKAAYDHFVGTWEGTDTYDSNGQTKQIPVRIVIRELPGDKGLELDYVYGRPSEKEYNSDVRFLKLDPAKGAVWLWWKGDYSKERYRATGLDEFLRAGLGTIVFADSAPLSGEHGERILMKCTLRLAQNELDYTWETSMNGSPFKVTGSFALSRTQASSDLNQPKK